MKLSFTEALSGLERKLTCLEYLAEHEVSVGLPPDASPRNTFILAVQEHGAPAMNIPARPVVAPALEKPQVRIAMASAMAEAVWAAAAGDLPGTVSAMEKAGQAGADGIRAYIDSGIGPPNAPVTVNGGWVWNRVAGKAAPVKGKGFNKPLYDTGELYRAFGCVIRSREE